MLSSLTSHARARMQQRGISPAALELLLEYGREAHDHRGCRIVRFDKRSRLRASSAPNASAAWSGTSAPTRSSRPMTPW